MTIPRMRRRTTKRDNCRELWTGSIVDPVAGNNFRCLQVLTTHVTIRNFTIGQCHVRTCVVT